MRNCFFIPGILGTNLGTNDPESYTVWVDAGRLGRGQFDKLRLHPDGVSPGSPGGVELVPGGVLTDFYGSGLKILDDQLEPRGYAVGAFGWDWRKSMRASGIELADLIRDVVEPGEPCAIVGHSLGGLVARYCWADLVRTNEQSKVRRIVTLGTPHCGSYAMPAFASGESAALDQLMSINAQIGGVSAFATGGLAARVWSKLELINLALTWPAIYESFPLLGGNDDGSDPHRERLYEKRNWPSSVSISQAWLDHARNVVGPFLRSSTSMPPAHIMTTVAGVGVPTRNRLIDPEHVGFSWALGTTDLGDGSVTAGSAIVPNTSKKLLACRHEDLATAATNSGRLADWVLDERQPGEPAGPIERVPGVVPAMSAGLPMAWALGGSPAKAGVCANGVCRC